MNSISKSSTSKMKVFESRMDNMPQIFLGMMFMSFINGMLSYFHLVTLNLLTFWIFMGISCIPFIIYLKIKDEVNPFLIGFIIQNLTAAIALAFVDSPSFHTEQQFNAGLLYYMFVCIYYLVNVFTKPNSSV